MFTFYFSERLYGYTNWQPFVSFFNIGEYLTTRKSFELTHSTEFRLHLYNPLRIKTLPVVRKVLLRKDGV